MTSAILATPALADAAVWESDLRTVGVEVLGRAETTTLLEASIRIAPDLVVCFENHPDDALFASTTAISRSAPRPVVVFTTDPDVENIERAAASGVHAYVINGYGLHRLRSVIQVAQARFRHEQLLREELTEVNQRFAERKLVDRAKGILMGARQIREDEAFRALRSAAMNTKQRIGQVSRQIIDAARYAEAVNRAGQLRMLSQRLVKLYAMLCADVQAAENQGMFADALEHVDRNLAILARTVSAATFGDLLDRVLGAWKTMKTVLNGRPSIERLRPLDLAAEELLQQSERLTTNLEIAGFATNLRVINVSGRQRMLSQRLAKQALLASLGGAAASATGASLATTEREFIDGLVTLRRTPLVTPEITGNLTRAEEHWSEYQTNLHAADRPESRDEIARLSELLLGDFDRLTDAYERALQSLFA